MNKSLAPAERRMVARKAAVTERVRKYAENLISENTKRAYAQAWKDYQDYCGAHGYSHLPTTETAIVDYLTERADLGRTYSTVQVAASAIGFYHRLQGLQSPATLPHVKLILAGIRREDKHEVRQVKPITRTEIRKMLNMLDGDVKGIRDRAMVLLGFALAARRSELVALRIEDVQFTEAGMRVRLNRTKTDDRNWKVIRSIGRNCPVTALRGWLSLAGIKSGTIFRRVTKSGRVLGKASDKDVARTIKRLCAAAGLDESAFSGHSLRSGLITQAALDGWGVHQISDVSDHKSADVLAGYIRTAGKTASDVVASALDKD